MKARLYGIDNEFSIIELCYDYNTNELNNEAMQKLMIAYDNLTEVMQKRKLKIIKVWGICLYTIKRNK